MATLNTAVHFNVERDIGSIAPGRYADIILSSDLATLPIELVIANGEIVAMDGRLTIDLPVYAYPDFSRDTVHLGKRLEESDFAVPAPPVAAPANDNPAGSAPRQVTARVIGVVENQAPTRAETRRLEINDGQVEIDVAQDVCHIALVERHQGTGKVTNGFVTGFGFNVPCAIASTVAHDSHHMLVAGTSRREMAQAANRLGEVGGGVVVFREGEEIALVELPIAGLMSVEHADIVARKAAEMTQAFRNCGCRLNNAFMQLSLLALVVIPELRISDLGLVDVNEFAVVPLIAGD
jgi:adenine deaminase